MPYPARRRYVIPETVEIVKMGPIIKSRGKAGGYPVRPGKPLFAQARPGPVKCAVDPRKYRRGVAEGFLEHD